MIAEIFPTFTFQLGKLKNKFSDEDYFELCRINECLVIERDKDGDFEIKSINGNDDSRRNGELLFQIVSWSDENKSGVCFSAFTGFTLPNGAVRAADFAWLKNETWECLSNDKKKRFACVCPDFVAEIRGWHESLETLQGKMQEYLDNSVSLGWLIDATERKVYIYRPGSEVEILENPAELSGEPLLKGFALSLREIWE